MGQPSKVISFRLDSDMARLLGNLAERSKLSPCEAARAMVIASLVGEDLALNEQLRNLLVAMDSIKKASAVSDRRLATALFHLLELVGKVPREQAKKIAQSLLEIGEGGS